MGEGYAAIPTWMLRDGTISGPALLVYASLASRAGYRSVHPGQALIAGEARCSERRVRDALKELEELHLIERVGRRYASGRRAPDGYILHSGTRPSSVAEQPAVSAGSESQPAEIDRANRQNPTFAPSIEITKEEIANVVPHRPDVERLLDYLDVEIRRRDPRKVPKRNKGNADAMRLLIDRDGYSEPEITAVIQWCQSDQFWHSNILSAAKLRDKFSTLHSQMSAGRGRNEPQSAASRAMGVDLGDMNAALRKGPQIGAQGSGGYAGGNMLELEGLGE